MGHLLRQQYLFRCHKCRKTWKDSILQFQSIHTCIWVCIWVSIYAVHNEGLDRFFHVQSYMSHSSAAPVLGDLESTDASSGADHSKPDIGPGSCLPGALQQERLQDEGLDEGPFILCNKKGYFFVHDANIAILSTILLTCERTFSLNPTNCEGVVCPQDLVASLPDVLQNAQVPVESGHAENKSWWAGL